jgi:hypothetical protein
MYPVDILPLGSLPPFAMHFVSFLLPDVSAIEQMYQVSRGRCEFFQVE